MKVSAHVVNARRERLARLIGQRRYLPIGELCGLLGVSEATARRDLAALQKEKRITRTYGGAFGEFDDRFPSFTERLGQSARAKSSIGQMAAPLIASGQTCFLDTGTTIHALAEAFAANPAGPVTVVTPNLPVADLLAAVPGISVFQLAGRLLHRQSVLLGEFARRSLAFWHFDIAFLSAESIDAQGVWNSDPEIVAQQQEAMSRARRVIFCIDSSKLTHRAPHFLASWSQVDGLITNATRDRLDKAGIHLDNDRLINAARKPSASGGTPPPAQPEDGPGSTDLPIHFL